VINQYYLIRYSVILKVLGASGDDVDGDDASVSG